MPSGYRVTLTNGSLTPGDLLSTGTTVYASAQSGKGAIYGTSSGQSDALFFGRFHLGTDGAVCFVPYDPITLTAGRVADGPAYASAPGVVQGASGFDIIDGS